MLKWSEKTGNLVQNMREIEIGLHVQKKLKFYGCITFESRKLSNERCNKKAGDLNRGLNKWTESGACQ